MGCSNSQLRPIFRRCRRRRSKKEEVTLTSPKIDLIERNGSAQDLLQGVQLLGASLRNNTNNTSTTTTSLIPLKSSTTTDSPQSTTDSSAFCVPLLAQSEASTSQIDFFRMLDQKIEEGPDYDSDDEEDRPLQRRSLPALRLDAGSDRKGFRNPAPKGNPLKFTNWNWDEEGD